MLLVHCIFGMGRLIEEGNSSSRIVGMQVLPWRASNGMRFERTVLCHYGFLRPKSFCEGRGQQQEIATPIVAQGKMVQQSIRSGKQPLPQAQGQVPRSSLHD